MSLKQIIKEQKILQSGVVDSELTLEGEPLIYSIKYRIGQRLHTTQFFRDKKWRSLLRCWFRAQLNSKTPVVLIVRFYVSPPSNVTVKVSELKSEKTPAVKSYEVCDYLLSFLEMLRHGLFNSYRQIVKIDAEKFYSNSPKTIFKFMTWHQYVKLQSGNPLHSESKSSGKNGQVGLIQS